MKTKVTQADERQLVQPQQWMGYEYPPSDESLLQSSVPPSTLPSAPSFTLPEYYDQVPGDVLASQPKPYQPQQYHPQYTYQPVVSTPIIVNASTTVNVGGVSITTQPAPYVLAGCCGMGNQKSATWILNALTALSFVTFIVAFYSFLAGVLSPAPYFSQYLLEFAFSFPSAILFPGVWAAQVGLSGTVPNVTGLILLLNSLTLSRWILFISSIINLILIIGAFIWEMIFTVSLFSPLAVIWLVILLISNLCFLVAFGKSKRVLIDYRMAILRRNVSNHL